MGGLVVGQVGRISLVPVLAIVVALSATLLAQPQRQQDDFKLQRELGQMICECLIYAVSVLHTRPSSVNSVGDLRLT